MLVGYDRSDGGRDALELARVLGVVEQSGALVVAVAPHARLPAGEAEPLLQETSGKLEGMAVQARVLGGSPAATIVDVAETEDVDAIVLGSPHRGPLGRTLIGSVAEGVLHGAPCAVLVAPRGYAASGHGPFATIAVAYDGTPEAKAALVRAQALAEQSRAALRILTVLAPPVAMPGAIGYSPINPPEPEEVVEEGIAAVMDEGVAAVGTAVPVDSRRLDGPPAQALAEACEDDVDLLVAGSRGSGPVARALLGSVSSRLIAAAPCPVLVVPRP